MRPDPKRCDERKCREILDIAKPLRHKEKAAAILSRNSYSETEVEAAQKLAKEMGWKCLITFGSVSWGDGNPFPNLPEIIEATGADHAISQIIEGGEQL